jgi:hypothetical protein
MTDENPRPFEGDYSQPVVSLLSYGDCREKSKPDYVTVLGLNQSHIPDLIRMATDI